MLLSMGTMWGLSLEVLQPANKKFPELQGVCAHACMHVCVCARTCGYVSWSWAEARCPAVEGPQTDLCS